MALQSPQIAQKSYEVHLTSGNSVCVPPLMTRYLLIPGLQVNQSENEDQHTCIGPPSRSE